MATAIRASLKECGLGHDLPQAYMGGAGSVTPLDLPSIPVLFTIPNPMAASELGPGRVLGVPETATTQNAPPGPREAPQTLSSNPSACCSAAKQTLKHTQGTHLSGLSSPLAQAAH